MNTRHTILFIFLTIVLIILAYSLLELIDRHAGALLVLAFVLLTIADIFLLSGFFIRFMKSDGVHKH